MKTRKLSFYLKGARNYIQGPDMWNESIKAIQENWDVSKVSNFDFTIHKMTGHNLCLSPNSPTTSNETLVGNLNFESGEGIVHLRLTEDDSIASERREYNEAPIFSACKIDLNARAVQLNETSPYTDIETFVSMTKALHLAVFPNAPGKWVFCRLQADSWPLAIDRKDLKIHIAQAFGTRLTKSIVSSKGHEAAAIYFSAKATT